MVQQQVIEQQDEELGVLSSAITRLGNMGKTINEELKSQGRLLDAFTEEERRSVQVAEGVLPDHIRKKMHELLGEEETPRAEISDGAKRQGRAMEEWWARQEARSTRAVRPAEPAIAAAAPRQLPRVLAARRDPVWETEFTDTPPWRA